MSELADALNKLSGLADNFITATTQRQIQVGKEKETRVVNAYNYMIGNEESEIAELETALSAIEGNLLDRGVELKSVKEQFRTTNSEELLSAANESAISMTNVRLNNSRDYRSRLEQRKREAQKIKRHIDLFDDAMSMVTPGEDNIVDASDVAKVANKFTSEYSQFMPEIEQRLTELQSESALDSLEADYFSRLKTEAQQKIDANTSSQVESKIKMNTLEPIKKEAVEGVIALFNKGDSISKLTEQFGAIITRQSEIDTDDSLSTSELQAKETEIQEEQLRIGSFLYPWFLIEEEAISGAQNLQTSLTKALKNGNFNDLIGYLETGNLNYNMMEPQEAATYQADVLAILGIDISNSDFISQLQELNKLAGRIDIEQANIMLEIGRTILPEDKTANNRTNDLDLYLNEEF
jgi:hypothetical protein